VQLAASDNEKYHTPLNELTISCNSIIGNKQEFSVAARGFLAPGGNCRVCRPPPGGHASSDLFLIDSFASYSALNLSIHSHSMKSMNKIIEDP
jgi:hypothetical protein